MRLVLFAAIALLAGCAAAPPPLPGPVVGGYSPANKSDPNVVAAEKLAIDEIYKRVPQRSLAETVSREQQVVAGMNYRFSIKMSGENSWRGGQNSYRIV